MSSLNKQLFNYLSNTENYKSSKEISRVIIEVDEQLREEFWKECVYNPLKEREEQNGNGKFQISLYEDRDYAQIRITKESWKDLYVCYEILNGWGKVDEKVYSSIVWDKLKFNSQKVQSICNEYVELELEHLNVEHPRWLCWKYVEYDFSKYETLLKILPDVRDSFAKEFADLLWEFAEKVEEFCDRINREKV